MADCPDTPSIRGVLVIDDDESIRKLLGAALPAHGFAVWQAANGADGVRLYLEHRKQISAVLLDVLMPGMDGPTTLTTLLKLAPRLPCAFMTGGSGNYTPQQLLDLGAQCILSKPLSLDAIAKTVKRLCHVNT